MEIRIGHTIALTTLPGNRDDGELDWMDQIIFAQCECGRQARFETPILLERVIEVCEMMHVDNG